MLTDILFNIIDNQDCGIIVLDKNLKTILINNWIIEHAKLPNKNLIDQDLISIFPQIQGQRLHIVIEEALHLNRASILSQAIHHSPYPYIRIPE